ncbi:hypothetical protein ABVK25_010843 [Lepraria finkii]|uniref:Zn(2)-C6 fungal-type domain-containing protein n=1 Tax=Lepraria finkii TaxID=1340010 RepID=A0ABR4AVP6_9LECA
MGKRSNGCVTWRKRKVKCDEAEPECERCKKATYKCAGYDQPWLDETHFIALARHTPASPRCGGASGYSKHTAAQVPLIDRTAEYHLLDQHGSLRFICYTFPATIAHLDLDKNSPQAKYIYEAFECNAGNSGFGFGEFTLDVATPLKMWIDSCRVRHQRQTPCPSSDGSPDTLNSDTVTADSSAMKTER